MGNTTLASSWHTGVAAEACAAALFARCGYDVSVQYGANQTEYDLMISRGDRMLKVSVKGSQDGSWGLTQSDFTRVARATKQRGAYHAAIDTWLARHNLGTIFCLVQFKGVAIDQMPRVYLATPTEIAQRLRETAGGAATPSCTRSIAGGCAQPGPARSSVFPRAGDFPLSASPS